jgi:hypothetical protein
MTPGGATEVVAALRSKYWTPWKAGEVAADVVVEAAANRNRDFIGLDLSYRGVIVIVIVIMIITGSGFHGGGFVLR